VKRRWSGPARGTCAPLLPVGSSRGGLTSQYLAACSVGNFSGSRWGSRRGAVPLVPADGRSPAFHDHDGQFFGHGLGVVVLRPRGIFFGRGQMPENRWGQAIEVDPGGHNTRPAARHDRTLPRQRWFLSALRSQPTGRAWRFSDSHLPSASGSSFGGRWWSPVRPQLTAQSGPGENESNDRQSPSVVGSARTAARSPGRRGQSGSGSQRGAGSPRGNDLSSGRVARSLGLPGGLGECRGGRRPRVGGQRDGRRGGRRLARCQQGGGSPGEESGATR
jgi:hypothetical protein